LRLLFAAVTFRARHARLHRRASRAARNSERTSVSLDRSTVKTIAYLARLRVADEQLERLSQELSGILHWVEQLKEVNTEGVEPMTSVVGMRLRQRDDEVTDGGDRQAILANAPAVIDDYYSVPKVVE
jgi:aspartyl-tRNA(Asn)/glutamyl-tRNA(Gln) amidotransferase subunit C